MQPFLIALATLSLITEASEAGPVLCIVDDAQWLDQATTEAVLMAARRLDADPVVMVLAARDGEGRTFAPADILSVEAAPLTEAAARAVLAETPAVRCPSRSPIGSWPSLRATRRRSSSSRRR